MNKLAKFEVENVFFKSHKSSGAFRAESTRAIKIWYRLRMGKKSLKTQNENNFIVARIN